MDLLDLYRGRLSYRRVSALLSGLPADSATARSVHGERVEWSATEHLLASVVDGVNVLAWQQTKDGARGRNAPKPIPRPTDPPKKRLGKTSRAPEEVKALLRRLAGREESSE